MKKHIILIIWLTFYSCYVPTKKYEEEYYIKFTNGEIYCVGKHLITERGSELQKHKNGVWSYYYFNGVIEKEEVYKNDILESLKLFNDKGILIEEKKYDLEYFELISEKKYYDNGKLKKELTKNLIMNKEVIEEAEYDSNGSYLSRSEESYLDYTTSIIKEYYINGNLYKVTNLKDREVLKTIIFDNQNNQILNIEN